VSVLVCNYLACWNERDSDARQKLIDRYWDERSTYVDPFVEVSGRCELNAQIGAVQKQFPGYVFIQIGGVDAHHSLTRFHWGFGPVGEVPVMIGFDVVVTEGNGQITQVLGFLDRAPE
jgi:hypothetical protein